MGATKALSKIAFSGSGLLFPAHVGALSVIAEHTEIVEVAGTSGGSMVASLFAVTQSLEETRNILMGLDAKDMVSFDLGALFSMGLSHGKKIERKMKDIIGDITFEQVRMPLKVIATDLVTGYATVFSKFTTPTIRVRDAVRASISIPFVFTPKVIKGVHFIDGGLVDNLPVNFLHDPKTTNEEQIYAVNLINTEFTSFFSKFRLAPSVAVHLVGLMLNAQARMQMNLASSVFDDVHTVNIDTSNIVKRLLTTRDENMALYEAGVEHTNALFV